MTLENLCVLLKIQTRKESEWQSGARRRHRAEQHVFLMFGRSRTGERPDLLPICHHGHFHTHQGPVLEIRVVKTVGERGAVVGERVWLIGYEQVNRLLPHRLQVLYHGFDRCLHPIPIGHSLVDHFLQQPISGPATVEVAWFHFVRCFDQVALSSKEPKGPISSLANSNLCASAC